MEHSHHGNVSYGFKNTALYSGIYLFNFGFQLLIRASLEDKMPDFFGSDRFPKLIIKEKIV